MPQDNAPNEQKYTVLAYSRETPDDQKPVVRAIARYIFLQEGIHSAVASITDRKLPNVLLLKAVNRPSELAVKLSALDRLPPLAPREAPSLPSPKLPESAAEVFSNILLIPQWSVDLAQATRGDLGALGAAARYVEGMLNSGLRSHIKQLLPVRDFRKKARQRRCSLEDARSIEMWKALIKVLSLLSEPLVAKVVSASVAVKNADGSIKAIPPGALDINAFRQWLAVATIEATRDLLNGTPITPDILVREVPADGGPPMLWWFPELAPEHRGRPVGSGEYPTPEDFHAAERKAISEFREREGRKPGGEDIAEGMHLSRRRYYELKSQYRG